MELFRAPNETKGPWTRLLRKNTELTLQEAQKIMMERLPDPREPVIKSKRSLTAEQLAGLLRLSASAEFEASK